MITLDKGILAKAKDINAYSMDSPTGREGKTGLLKIGVYFIGKATKDGKPAKGAKAWTPNQQDATKLKIDCQPMPESLTLKGTTYRWIKHDLEQDDMEAIRQCKGKQKANRIVTRMKQDVCKGLTSAYVKSLDIKDRKLLVEDLSQRLNAACNTLLNVSNEDEAESALF